MFAITNIDGHRIEWNVKLLDLTFTSRRHLSQILAKAIAEIKSVVRVKPDQSRREQDRSGHYSQPKRHGHKCTHQTGIRHSLLQRLDRNTRTVQPTDYGAHTGPRYAIDRDSFLQKHFQDTHVRCTAGA